MNLVKELLYLLKYPGKSYKYFKYKVERPKRYKIIQCKDNYLEFPIFGNPVVSIVIPVYNQYKYTLNCLYSILNTIKDIPYEIIIADDCSNDETAQISDHIKNIRVIKTPQNIGFLRNCNNACKYAKGEYIWLLNNDTQVLEESLSYLLKTFKEHKDTGAVGSKLIFKNKIVQEAGGIIYQNASGWNYGRNEKNIDKYELNYFKEVDYCSGASLLIKKELWDDLHGFDEYFVPAYYEETDLCFRIREKGYKVYYQPKSEIIHFESVSLKKSHNDLMAENNKKFFEKWKDVLKNQSKNSSENFVARDRTQNKKILLFADLGFLKTDTNCGNRSSYQYLKLFVEMGFNVKYIGVGTDSKDIDYKDQITEIGVEILDYEKIKKWFKEFGHYVDYAYINRPKVWNSIESHIKKYCPKCKTIYQGHDIHYLREQREAELYNDKKKLKISKQTEKIENEIWANADYVLYYSQNEIDIVNKYTGNTANHVATPLYLYPELNNIKPYNASERKNLIFVGSGHPPNVDAIEWLLTSIFPKVKNDIPDIKIYIVGKNVPKELYKYQNESIIFTGYVTDAELINLYSKVRMAVIPLRFGAGVKGKVIEAVRYNVPVLTSDVGVEGINNSENIINVANTESEFVQKIKILYNDIEKLNNISIESQNFIKNNFSYKQAYSIMKNILS